VEKQKLQTKEKVGYGLGAVGKDMVYMLSASYVLYYFQDIMGVSSVAMAIILLAARIFDAFNDPIMGVIVAKTKTRWGKFRPWLLVGTLTNAIILFLMFACPPTLDAGGLIAWAAVFYILWGVTYTMMDIPYWSMIPAFTSSGKERESLTTLARSCAGVGSAIVSIFTMMIVSGLGSVIAGDGAASSEIERIGFKYVSLIVAVLFVVFIVITCITIKENSTVDMQSATLKQMFSALVHNDQAMAAVITIVLVNTALYITSNLVIYFFKYDLGGESWYTNYTLFNMVGGAAQILAMMLLFPLLRKAFSTIKIFYISLCMSIIGYVIILLVAMSGGSDIWLYLIPGILVMASSGMNNVIVTIFLANTVDYGQLKNGRRDESVIFSMQTFVVKLASGIAAFIAAISLGIFNLSSSATTEAEQSMDLSLNVAASSKMGLRLLMTVGPIIILIFAMIWFSKKYILTDEKMKEIVDKL